MKRETIARTFKPGRQFEASGDIIKVNPGVLLTVYALRGRLIIQKVAKVSLADDTITVWNDRGESYIFENDSLAAVKIEEVQSKTTGRSGFLPDA